MRAFYMLAVARHAHKSGRELTASLNQAKPNTLTEHEHVVHDSKICVTVRNNDDVINDNDKNNKNDNADDDNDNDKWHAELPPFGPFLDFTLRWLD